LLFFAGPNTGSGQTEGDTGFFAAESKGSGQISFGGKEITFTVEQKAGVLVERDGIGLEFQSAKEGAAGRTGAFEFGLGDTEKVPEFSVAGRPVQDVPRLPESRRPGCVPQRARQGAEVFRRPSGGYRSEP
jgi:hypothetical protein